MLQLPLMVLESITPLRENPSSLQARGTEMLQLPGEDAIVNWPNAKQSIIDDRDAFMARTLWAAATGLPLFSVC